MRALTLTQPWAGLVASGLKKIENRGREMIRREDFDKPFALHAGKTPDNGVYETIRKIAAQDPPDLRAMSWSDATGSGPSEWYRLSKITSAVIAVATVHSVIRFADLRAELAEVGSPNWLPEHMQEHAAQGGLVARDQARWMFGEVCYVLRDIRVLSVPVICRGYQAFFTLPDDAEQAVRAQIGGVC